MWQAIEKILLSDNSAIVLFFLVIIILLLAHLSNKGVLKWHTEKLTIGASEDERAIIRQQVEWTELEIESLASAEIFSRVNNVNEWRTKYILEKIFDEILQWIIFNHIKDSPEYISIKQEKIWNMTQTLVFREEFRSDEFKDFIYKEVDKIIKRLIFLRRQYGTSR